MARLTPTIVTSEWPVVVGMKMYRSYTMDLAEVAPFTFFIYLQESELVVIFDHHNIALTNIAKLLGPFTSWS